MGQTMIEEKDINCLVKQMRSALLNKPITAEMKTNIEELVDKTVIYANLSARKNSMIWKTA